MTLSSPPSAEGTDTAAPAVAPFVFRLELDGGRVAVLAVPDDMTQREFLQLVSQISGPGDDALIAHQEKAATMTKSGLSIVREPLPRT